ncbi:MAG: DinB family protein [Bacteroidia bacterium]|nr:DinB family protein [Bacteroidia bacterium]
MVGHSIKRLNDLTIRIPSLLSSISEKDFTYKASAEKWSKKEILGHLIDSATNNHQRFVRLQFEQEPLISYNQNSWAQFSYHQTTPTDSLIKFWTTYNKYLIHIISEIPEKYYQNVCRLANGDRVTLEFLITDYVKHQEHHLKQIVNYNF